MSRPPSLPIRILKSIKRLTGFSHIYHPGGLNSTFLSQHCVPEIAPTVGRVGRVYLPRRGEKMRHLQLTRSAHSSTRGDTLSMTLSNTLLISTNECKLLWREKKWRREGRTKQRRKKREQEGEKRRFSVFHSQRKPISTWIPTQRHISKTQMGTNSRCTREKIGILDRVRIARLQTGLEAWWNYHTLQKPFTPTALCSELCAPSPADLNQSISQSIKTANPPGLLSLILPQRSDAQTSLG